MGKHSRAFALAAGIAALIVAGCGHTVQTTSGREFLAAYDAEGRQYTNLSAIDEAVKQAANVEPNLRFPARIGLARIAQVKERNLTYPRGAPWALSAIPEDEAKAWTDAREHLGPKFGEFVPVIPLLADMMKTPQTATENAVAGHAYRPPEPGKLDVITQIRMAAARQHLDAVLVYEVYGTSDARATPLAITDATILGAFVVPSRKVGAQGFAQALLLDVRNAYPYGSASKLVEGSTHATAVRTERVGERLADDMMSRAAVAMVPEVEAMFARLAIELSQLDVAKKRN